mmetsp:Transcript_8310/g.23758  ORF Transcript_8310/g.23758 Transcript_8310/m.23758 type:complete len:231 (-) Transcript_8310:3150-3842(-)
MQRLHGLPLCEVAIILPNIRPAALGGAQAVERLAVRARRREVHEVVEQLRIFAEQRAAARLVAEHVREGPHCAYAQARAPHRCLEQRPAAEIRRQGILVRIGLHGFRCLGRPLVRFRGLQHHSGVVCRRAFRGTLGAPRSGRLGSAVRGVQRPCDLPRGAARGVGPRRGILEAPREDAVRERVVQCVRACRGHARHPEVVEGHTVGAHEGVRVPVRVREHRHAAGGQRRA